MVIFEDVLADFMTSRGKRWTNFYFYLWYFDDEHFILCLSLVYNYFCVIFELRGSFWMWQAWLWFWILMIYLLLDYVLLKNDQMERLLSPSLAWLWIADYEGNFGDKFDLFVGNLFDMEFKFGYVQVYSKR